MKRLAAGGIAMVVWLVSPPADAFCRSTSCKVGCSVDENGCPSTGKPLVWARPMPLTFRFQARGTALLINEEARAAVRAAFFRWADVVCERGRTSLRFVEGEDLVEDKPLTESGDAVQSVTPFGIYFRDNGWPHPARIGDGALALTTILFGTESAKIEYADIEINTGGRLLAISELAEGDDLQTVVTHEVGHYLGLAHSRATNSIMNASLCASGDRCQRDKLAARRLADDDRAAVCAVFPPGARFAADSDESGGCSVSPGRNTDGPVLALVGSALALAVVQRKRRMRRERLTARESRRVR